MDYRFYQVDVFTDRMFGGNSLAVFPDGAGLTQAQMQALANEMNLSETTFLWPPDDPADIASVRIFTPGTELPFAGHPTIGTAFVLAQLGRLPARSFSFQERIGRIPVNVEGDIRSPDMIWMEQPLPTFGPAIEDRAGVARLLGVANTDLLDTRIRTGSAGVPFLYVGLRTADAVDRARLADNDFSAFRDIGAAQGVFLFAPVAGDETAAVYSRMLGSGKLGIVEDPATGGASGPLGVFLVSEGLVPHAPRLRIVSHQGAKMGRPSDIQIDLELEDGQVDKVRVGGCVVPVLDGTVRLP